MSAEVDIIRDILADRQLRAGAGGSNAFVGAELASWIMTRRQWTVRARAVALLSDLVKRGYLVRVGDAGGVFSDTKEARFEARLTPLTTTRSAICDDDDDDFVTIGGATAKPAPTAATSAASSGKPAPTALQLLQAKQLARQLPSPPGNLSLLTAEVRHKQVFTLTNSGSSDASTSSVGKKKRNEMGRATRRCLCACVLADGFACAQNWSIST